MNIDQNLLDRYKNGTCTKEELEWLKSYFQQGDFSELEQILLAEWEDLKDENISTNVSVKAAIWGNLPDDYNLHIKKPYHSRRRRYLLAAAASVMLLIIAGSFFQKGFWNQDGRLAKVENTSTAPKSILLEDGSLVWLTPGSKLSYPKHFSGEERRVLLQGEARFEVQSDSIHPFIVQTEQLYTRVLGTTFNIQAFPKRETIEVVLLEGRVAVDIQDKPNIYETATLVPGEAFTFHKYTRTYSKKQLEDIAHYEWQKGIIHFQRANIYEVIETLENWYAISIKLQDSTETYESLVHRINTQKMNLEEVLDGISLVSNYHFKKSGKKEYLVIAK